MVRLEKFKPALYRYMTVYCNTSLKSPFKLVWLCSTQPKLSKWPRIGKRQHRFWKMRSLSSAYSSFFQKSLSLLPLAFVAINSCFMCDYKSLSSMSRLLPINPIVTHDTHIPGRSFWSLTSFQTVCSLIDFCLKSRVTSVIANLP